MPANSANKLFNISQAAKYLGVTKRTLRRWEKAGKIHSLRTIGGHRRYDFAVLQNLKNSKYSRYNEPSPAVHTPVPQSSPTPYLPPSSQTPSTLPQSPANPRLNSHPEPQSLPLPTPLPLLMKPRTRALLFCLILVAALSLLTVLTKSKYINEHLLASPIFSSFRSSRHSPNLPDDPYTQNALSLSVLGADVGDQLFRVNIRTQLSQDVTLDENLSIGQEATVQGNLNLLSSLNFPTTGEALTSTIPGYLTSSGGFSLGQAQTYYLDATGNANLSGGTFENALLIGGPLTANGLVTLGDGGDGITANGSIINLSSASTINLTPSSDTDDYIYFSSTSDSPGLFFAGISDTNDPGIRINHATGQIEYRDENSADWNPLDSLSDTLDTDTPISLFTDGGAYLYPTSRESLRIYDSDGSDYIEISHNGTNAVLSGTGAINFNQNLNLAGGSILTLPNSNTLTGTAGFTQFSNGISVGGANTFSLDASGNLSISSLTTTTGSLIDLSAITHSDTSVQGLRLPQNTTLTNVSSGEGYLAYDTSSNEVMVFNGTSWTNISGASTTLQQAYEAGNSIDVTNAEGDLNIDLTSANFILAVGQGAATGDFQIWDGTSNWFYIDESADTLSIGEAASSISLGTSGITTTISGHANFLGRGLYSHGANQGLLLPTSNGPPAAVAGTSEGDIVYDTLNNALYVYDGGSFSQIGGSGFSNFDITDGTTTQTINSGNTITFSDGSNINAEVSATDTVTISLTDSISISGTLTAATDETLNGIDINSGTVSDVVNLTINSGGDLTIGSIGLNDVGASNVTSGASLVGIFDEFDNSSSLTVQDVLDDLDAAIGNRSYTEENYLTNGESLTASLDALDQQLADVSAGSYVGWDLDVNDAGDDTIASGETVNIDEGAGISLTYTAATNTLSIAAADTSSTNELQNLFATFAVSGQNSVVADSTTDTLTLAAGTNVSITTDDTTDTITISSTDTNTTYTAGNDLDLSGTTFNLESTLDFVDTINLAGTGTLNGLDATDATTENTIESLIFDADAESISGVWTVADNVAFRIGSGGDLSFTHNGTDSTLTSTTGDFILDNTNTTGSTLVRLGTDTSATDFTIQNNSTNNVLSVLGDGTVSLGSDGVGASLSLYNELGATDYTVSFTPSSSQTETTAYILPPDLGSADYVLTTDGSGTLAWQEVTGIGGAGDITAVGNITSGPAFTLAVPGTSLYFGAGAELLDANGNELLGFTTTASAVNEFTLTNAATGNNPAFSPTGSDTNIGMDVVLKGTGSLNLSSTIADADSLAIVPQSTATDAAFSGTITSADLTADRTWSFPDATGTVCLTSGNCIGTGGAGDVIGPASATDHALARFDTTTGKLIQNSSVTLSDTGDLSGIANLTASGTLTAATDETLNGIDINSGTVSDVVNLTINSGGDLTIGSIGLNDVGASNVTSGASLVGIFDEFDNSSSLTVQDVLDDLDAAIGNRSYTEENYLTNGESLTASLDALDQQLADVSAGSYVGWDLDVNDAGDDTIGSGETVNIDEGAGISLTYTAATNTLSIAAADTSSTNELQNLFATFAVSGQNSVVADSTTDTVTLAAGTNVSITTDDTTDTITISSTDTNTTYTAGNDLDLSGTTFNLESTLDFVDTINLAGTGTLNGLDAVDATTENTIESLIFDADAESISGVWTVADNVAFRIGSGGDLSFTHNGTDSTLTSTTGDFILDNTNTTGSTLVRLGTDTSATDFTIQNNSTNSLFSVLGDGTVTVGSDGVGASLSLYNELGATDYTVSFTPSSSQTETTAYILPPDLGSADYVLTTDGSGTLAWQEVTGIGGAGDITAVGNITSGPAFTLAVPGTSLYFGAGAELLDANGNELLGFTTTASAVNEFTLTNAATGNNPAFSPTGSDTNIGMDVVLKGTGSLNLSSTIADADSLAIVPQSTGTDAAFSGTITSADLTADRTWSFPDATGTVCLTSGNCIGTGGAGDVIGPASATDHALARFDTTTGKLIQNSSVTLSDTGDLSGIANLTASGSITAATDETLNGIDINSGTVSDVVNLTINSGGDLTIGSIGLNDVGASNVTSGASLVGIFDEFDNSSSLTVQDVLDDLDAAIGNRSYTEENYLTNGESLTASLDALDQQLADVSAGSYVGWDLDVNDAGDDTIASGETVNIDEGAGISLTYTAATNTLSIAAADTSSTNELQNLFATFAVSGQNSVVADSTTDTVTLAAGTNVSITTDDTTDTITISSTDTNTTYTAGNDLDLSGTTFNLESTLDFVDTINLAGTGTLNGLDAVDATTENTIESLIFDADAESISGVWTVADNVAFRIGSGGDLSFTHNGTDSTLTSTTGNFILDNTNTTGSTLVRLGTDTSATDFTIQNNSTNNLLSVLGDGTVGIGTSPSGAFLDLAAPTTSLAQLNLTPSSSVDKSSPADGDLWYNGTNLYFYDGSSSVDLLAGGGGSPWQTNSNVVNLVNSGDTVTIGSTTALGKLSVDGDADEVQLYIQGNGTQNANLALFEQSDGTDRLTLSNSGTLSTSDMVLGLNDTSATISTADTNEDLTIDPNGTGDIYFHGSTYNLSDTGDFTLGGRITFENSEYISNETNDQLIFGLGGNPELNLSTTALSPSTAEGLSLGTTSNEWEALYLGDDSGLFFGLDQNFSLGYDETTDDRLELVSTNEDFLISLGTGLVDILGTSEQLRLSYDTSNYHSFTINDQGELTFADTGTNIATFSENQVRFGVPASFNSSGDVTIAYDLILSNQTASHITSLGPLTISAGEPFENNNLTLRSYNSGNVIFDIDGSPIGLINDTGLTVNGQATVSANIASNYAAGFINDGNNTNRYGILVQAGLDNQASAGPSTLVQFHDGDGTNVGAITFGSSVTNYNTTSDIRLKENITDTSLGLDELLAINVRDYQFIADDSGRVHTGFIAQEINEIYPEAVTRFEDGRYWQVDYGKLTPLIIAGVQDLDSKLTNLSSTVSTLNSKVSTHTNKLNQLETTVQSLTTTAAEHSAITNDLINVDAEHATKLAELTYLTTELSNATNSNTNNIQSLTQQIYDLTDSLQTGRLGIGTTAPASDSAKLIDTDSGAFLSSSGVWTNVSDVNKKTNFRGVDEDVILAGILDLPITYWNYKSDSLIPNNNSNTPTHIGPTAQDFYATFGLGQNDTSISTIDPSSIALVGIKALNSKLENQGSQLAELTKAQTKVQKALADAITQTNQKLNQLTDISLATPTPTGPAPSPTPDLNDRVASLEDQLNQINEKLALSQPSDLTELPTATSSTLTDQLHSDLLTTQASLSSLLAQMSATDQILLDSASTSADVSQLGSFPSGDPEGLDNLSLDDILTSTTSAMVNNLSTDSYDLIAVQSDIALIQENLNLATSSADLTYQAHALFGSNSEQTIEDLIVSDTATLHNVGITGTLTTGFIEIDGIEGSISTTILPLRLQTNPLAGEVEIFNRKIVMSPQGDMVIDGSLTAEKVIAKDITSDTTTAKTAVLGKINIATSSSDLLSLNEATSSSELIASESESALPNPSQSPLSTDPSVSAVNFVPSIGSSILTDRRDRIFIRNDSVTSASKIFVTPISLTQSPLAVIDIKPGLGFTVAIASPAPTPIEFNWWIIN